jgi:hypothetical protein
MVLSVVLYIYEPTLAELPLYAQWVECSVYIAECSGFKWNGLGLVELFAMLLSSNFIAGHAV